MQKIQVRPLGQEDPLEVEMATHASILAWKIPCTEEPGRLQSMRPQSQTQLSTQRYVSRRSVLYPEPNLDAFETHSFKAKQKKKFKDHQLIMFEVVTF